MMTPPRVTFSPLNNSRWDMDEVCLFHTSSDNPVLVIIMPKLKIQKSLIILIYVLCIICTIRQSSL